MFAYLLLFISFFVGERSMGRGIESCAENVRRFCHSKVRRPFVSFVCVFCVCVCVCVSFNHSLGSHSILEILAKVLMDELVESSVRFVKEKYPAF